MRKLKPNCCSAGAAPRTSEAMTPASTTTTSTAKARVSVLKAASPNAPWRPAARRFLPIAISADTARSELLRTASRTLDEPRPSRTRAGPHRLAVRPGDLLPALLQRAAHLVGNRHIVELLDHLAATTQGPVEEAQHFLGLG